MAKTESHIPKLRFAGFADPWQNKKLSKVFSIFAGNAFASKDQVEQGIKWLKISDVGIQRMNSNNLSYLPKGYEIEYFKYLVKKEDVVIALTRPISDGKLKISIIDDEYNGALLNQRVGKLISLEHNLLFIYTMLQKSDVVSKLEQSIAGTDPPNLSLNEIKDILLTVPQYQEQTKIGDFFQKIDQVIELQQKALETAQDYKKSMLQKLFPQKGEKVPKVRFDGFSGYWEKNNLNGITNINPSSNLPNEFYYVDLESVKGSRLIGCRTENKETAPSRAQRLAIHGDVFYQTVRPYQKNNYLFTSYENNYVFSTGYAQLRPLMDNDSAFIFAQIQNEKFVNDVLERCTGTSYPSINSTDLSLINIYAPKLEEQQKIGAFFQKLDQQIEQHEKKLESYQQLKKAMLQRMFV